jgi:hypothetical protein
MSKYGRDHGGTLTPGMLAKMIADQHDRDPTDWHAIADIIDDEFFIAAWENFFIELEQIRDSKLFLADVRGLIYAAYKEGLKRGEARANATTDSKHEHRTCAV